MLNTPFLRIVTKKFQKLDGEDEELVNEGMYGKSLSIFLQSQLISIGYQVPFYTNEDWGWWVEVSGIKGLEGICIYSNLGDDGIIYEYVIKVAFKEGKKWNWKNFRFISTVNEEQLIFLEKLNQDLIAIFTSEIGIDLVEKHTDFPW